MLPFRPRRIPRCRLTAPNSDNSRYHLYGARDRRARAAHADVSRAWRREIATLAFDDRDKQVLLAAVREGMTVAEAGASISVSHQQVYGRARWDYALREALEDALAQTCPAGQYCGIPGGVRHHGGRCHACRAAKHPPRAATGRAQWTATLVLEPNQLQITCGGHQFYDGTMPVSQSWVDAVTARAQTSERGVVRSGVVLVTGPIPDPASIDAVLLAGRASWVRIPLILS
ncbi:hypothetical protein [Nocardia farcinica]|uniref:hypothetical protein n=1 Tax=Nocardia farcinica TaxID=37329 RepID=UPI000C004AD9|nr:hypothetical protein [Nocardia farcinica]MCZ9325743.1 hypothetical protein [Nocardia farcinica]PFX00073.1 hypothetical protein CJ469_04856 [Nocardia farcinica]PFX05938.1 hypothetical protein CJ468_05045 [Nocardia farcinica]SUE28325.1 Uncharacterised protein [Nocardia farcinica]